MKRVIATLVLIFLFASQVFAFGYPPSLGALFQKYCDQHTTLRIVTQYVTAKDYYKVGDPVVAVCKEYKGQVIVAALDYFVFKLTDGDVVIIPYSALVEASEE